MKKFLYYRPEILAFFSGALVMVFEILGARIVGPYIGSSLFVWTSLIAIILLALSLGAYYGGKIADKRSDLELISKIFLLASLGIFLLILSDSFILEFISSQVIDIRISSIILALILFSPVSFLLGLIGPIVTKLRISDLDSSGQVIGKISSLGTIGSIIGTLGAGFVLIPLFEISHLLIGIGVCCLILSVLCNFQKYLFLQFIVFGAFIITYIGNTQVILDLEARGIIVQDTPYSHVTIADDINLGVRNLYIDNITHAGMYLDSDELLYDYTKYYHLFDSLVPSSKNILMLGGAAYSFPKSFLQTYPYKTLDVVEIDANLTDLAKKYFHLTDNPRLGIYHQDARVFLNNTTKQYDAILGDAFGSFYSIPYQLTTLEVAQKKYNSLSDNGIVILNVIGSLEGKNAQFLESEYFTYQQVFHEVFIIPVKTQDPQKIQNIMLIALKNPDNTHSEIEDFKHRNYISKKIYLDIPKDTQILTDNYAPVDYMIAQMGIN